MALDPATWEEVRRRRAAGESIAALAKAFGLSASSLGRKLAAQAKAAAPRRQPAARKPSKPGPRSKRTSSAGRRRPASRARPVPPATGVRRQLIARLYRAIDTKLKLMERRMNSEIHALEAGGGNAAAADDAAGFARNSADHERETRAFGALVKTINSVRQMQAELDTLANAPTASAAAGAAPTAADARLAADAERYRRDIAERLAKFVPPQS